MMAETAPGYDNIYSAFPKNLPFGASCRHYSDVMTEVSCIALQSKRF